MSLEEDAGKQYHHVNQTKKEVPKQTTRKKQNMEM